MTGVAIDRTPGETGGGGAECWSLDDELASGCWSCWCCCCCWSIGLSSVAKYNTRWTVVDVGGVAKATDIDDEFGADCG